MLRHLPRLWRLLGLMRRPDPARSDRLLGTLLIFLMCLMLVLFARHAIARDAALARGPLMSAAAECSRSASGTSCSGLSQ